MMICHNVLFSKKAVFFGLAILFTLVSTDYISSCKGRFRSESCGAQEVSHPRSKLSPFLGAVVKLLPPHGEVAGFAFSFSV